MTTYTQLYGITPISDTLTRYAAARHGFNKTFDGKMRFFSASGRCELLGNHTDHNNGKVLTSAINNDIIAAVSRNNDNVIRVFSSNNKCMVDVGKLAAKETEKGKSSALIRGVVHYFATHGKKVGGYDCYTVSNVPRGSGLSSSAAFEVLTAQILNVLYNNGNASAMFCATAGQYAENVYFGKPCGLLDQCGVALGNVSFIDFFNATQPKVKQCECNFPNLSSLVVITKESHAQLTPYYAAICEDMKSVAAHFGCSTLSQVEEAEFLNYYHSQQPTNQLNRALHFYEENQRVQKAYDALCANDEKTFLDMVRQSGNSSRYLLKNCTLPDEDSSPLTDIMDGIAQIDPDAAVRVHGGGFRGGVLVLCSHDTAEKIKSQYAEAVKEIFFRKAGACEVDVASVFSKA